MKNILILLFALVLIVGCSKQNININPVGNISNTIVTPCKDVSLKANIVNVNQEKSWVSVKISNTGNSNIDSILVKILGDKLTAKVKKPLIIGETRVETTNYAKLVNGSIGLEVVPIKKIGNTEISCSTKTLVLYKKVEN